MGRLNHIDALRGFALLGILLLHAYGSFGIYLPAEKEIMQSGSLDTLASSLVNFFVRNKAFAVFSVMFGFSFYLQMERSKKKGREFEKYFAWRLLILLLFGYINAMVFRSDILTKYALMGFVLLLIYRLPVKYMILITVLLLLQIPEWIQIISSLQDAHYQVPVHRDQELWDTIYQISATGSFAELIKINMWPALIELWKLNFTSGRIAGILGYFFLGFLLGKSRLLENIAENRKEWVYIATGSAILYLVLRQIRAAQSNGFSEVSQGLTESLITVYMNFFMVTILVSGFVLLYQITIGGKLMNILAPYGRMSLTSYIFQSFAGVFVFYGFGLGMYNYLGNFLSLLTGIVIFGVLLLFSHIWFRFYYYGPIEWLWRAAAHRTWNIPLRKQSN